MEKIIKCRWFNLPLLRVVRISLFVIGYFFTAQMSCIASAPRDEAAVPAKKMGVEIETSAIKIESGGDSKIGFNILNSAGNQWIIVEEDTSDTTFKSVPDLAPFNKNLECKTFGGLDQVELIDAASHIHNILTNLYASSVSAPRRITEDILSSITGISKDLIISHSDRIFSIKSKPEDQVVRPQITYQLPFEEIIRVFSHLKDLGHSSIADFLNIIDPSISFKPADLSGLSMDESNPKGMMIINDMKAVQIIKEYFNREVTPVFISIDDPKLKGFCCLFFYYWYELFNNTKLIVEEREPGLKQFLGIMSRISFSELYDSLDPTEQAKLKSILDPLVASHGGSFKLKAYKAYDKSGRPIRVETGKTLLDWYHSIIGGNSARPSGADLLSPPPEMLGDSMGKIGIAKSDGLPLIEARGYASLAPELTISISQAFIETEANWFFNESK